MFWACSASSANFLEKKGKRRSPRHGGSLPYPSPYGKCVGLCGAGMAAACRTQVHMRNVLGLQHISENQLLWGLTP